MTVQRMNHLGTFTSERKARAKIAEMSARYPQRTYDLRVQPGGRFYIVCTNAGEPDAPMCRDCGQRWHFSHRAQCTANVGA